MRCGLTEKVDVGARVTDELDKGLLEKLALVSLRVQHVVETINGEHCAQLRNIQQLTIDKLNGS